jgi:hypothetical protein
MVDVQGKIVDRLETAETLGYSVKSEKRPGGAFRGNGIPQPDPRLLAWNGNSSYWLLEIHSENCHFNCQAIPEQRRGHLTP